MTDISLSERHEQITSPGGQLQRASSAILERFLTGLLGTRGTDRSLDVLLLFTPRQDRVHAEQDNRQVAASSCARKSLFVFLALDLIKGCASRLLLGSAGAAGKARELPIRVVPSLGVDHTISVSGMS